MQKVKIIAAPAGEAPLWVRKAWVGLELPLDEVQGEEPVIGALGGKPAKGNRGGYLVPFQEAVEILRASNPRAARWWDNSPLAGIARSLAFGKQYCELV